MNGESSEAEQISANEEVTVKYAAISILLLWGALSWAQEPGVRITQSDGSVEIRKSGAQAWRPAKEGDALERGDRVAAREKSAALLLWSNGSMVKVYPNTEITLAGVTFDLDRKMENTIVDLEKGRLFVKAQTPGNLFADFRIRMDSLDVRSQGAEFAIEHNPDKKSFTAWTLIGRVVTDLGTERVRIDDAQQLTITAGTQAHPGDVKPMDETIRQSLAKVSKDLGGSLFAQEVSGTAGGKLVAKIGGVASRRGDAPYKINFKALAAGGSGKIKSCNWDFGDGESASGMEVGHTFTQGLYIIVLRVEDENGQKSSAQIGISVEADCGC